MATLPPALQSVAMNSATAPERELLARVEEVIQKAARRLRMEPAARTDIERRACCNAAIGHRSNPDGGKAPLYSEHFL